MRPICFQALRTNDNIALTSGQHRIFRNSNHIWYHFGTHFLFVSRGHNKFYIVINVFLTAAAHCHHVAVIKNYITHFTRIFKGGMVTDFSGTSILSNEFVVIGRASTDNLGVLLDPCAQCGPCGHRCQKVDSSQ